MKIFLILLLSLILLIPPIFNMETFMPNLGMHLKFLKKDKSHNRLDPEDHKLIQEIQNSYVDKNKYYKKINEISIPYLENPKKDNTFKKMINYRKSKNLKDLLPYHKN